VKSICFLLPLLLASNSVLAGEIVKGPGFVLDGKSAADLSEAWWKWAMSSPAEVNPVRDMSGDHCAVGQEGRVWFLAGGFGSSKISRACTIPFGKYVFFPAVNMAYWPPEEDSDLSCERAKDRAAVNNDTAIELFVEVDGVSVRNPRSHRARTEKCFDIYERIPKPDKPYRAYPSASDGFWFLLAPLKRGAHTIKFGGRYVEPNSAFGRMVQDIEYRILVE
jgi:hypothetical protein